MLFHREPRRPSLSPFESRDYHWTPSSTNFPASTCRVPNGSPAGPSRLRTRRGRMFDDHRHVPDRTQQIRIVEQVVPTHVQPRVPTELPKARHRAPHLSLALIEGKKADEIESCASYTGSLQSLQFLVRNAVIDNTDATIAVWILQAFQGMQQKPMITTVDCAMDNDATREADRLMHFLRFAECRAFDRCVWRILPRRKLRRVVIYMKLAIAAFRWWRGHWHPRLFVPFVEFLFGLCHSHLLCPWYSFEGFFWSPNLTCGA